MPFDHQAIAQITREFLASMTIEVSDIRVAAAPSGHGDDQKSGVSVLITMEDPKMLIGQGGQTLMELQRILRMVLNKKLGRFFYVSVDVNEYRAQKIAHLKTLAQEAANEVQMARVPKVLPPMNAYERRVLHQEFSAFPAVTAESEGEGENRRLVVRPR